MSAILEEYLRYKAENPMMIVAIRIGEFYEFFFDDAYNVGRILNLHITNKWKYKGENVPMCGFPHYTIEEHIRKLLQHKKRIVLVDEVNKNPSTDLKDPDTNKKSNGYKIQREIRQKLTPGTILDTNLISSDDNNNIIGISWHNNLFNIVVLDVSVGNYDYYKVDQMSIISHLAIYNPKEIIITSRDILKDIDQDLCELILSEYNDIIFEHNIQSDKSLYLQQYPWIEKDNDIMILLIDYINMMTGVIVHIRDSKTFNKVIINPNNLISLGALPSKENSNFNLLKHLNRTCTAFGSRKLRKWIIEPLSDKKAIYDRLDIVDRLISDKSLYASIIESLKSIKDIERILERIVLNKYKRKDIVEFAISLRAIEKLIILSNNSNLIIIDNISDILRNIRTKASSIWTAINCYCIDFHDILLKNCSTIVDAMNDQIQQIESESRIIHSKYRILHPSIELRYKLGLGYVIEIDAKHSNLLTDKLDLCQTNVHRHFFTSQDLLDLTTKYQLILERKEIAVQNVISSIVAEIINIAELCRLLIDAIGSLDILAGFASVADQFSYIRPNITTRKIDIINGKHPLINAYKASIMANSLSIDDEEDIVMIFGANMGGKSTFLKQTALIFIMMHIGSYVSCEKCDIPIVDQIFTRIGSGDDIFGSKSTFFIEMEEISKMINNATSKSLCIIDEICRGTSSEDGEKIANAILVYFANYVKARVLCATHFKNLFHIAEYINNVKNMTAEPPVINGNHIMYSHKILNGFIDNGSYAKEVAVLAGLRSDILSD